MLLCDRINPDESIEIGDASLRQQAKERFLAHPRSDNVVIGLRSIITKKIPPNTLAIGIPAKVVRTNIFLVGRIDLVVFLSVL